MFWRGCNIVTGEAIYGNSKSDLWAKILQSECFKSVSKTETYAVMADVIAQWEITGRW